MRCQTTSSAGISCTSGRILTHLELRATSTQISCTASFSVHYSCQSGLTTSFIRSSTAKMAFRVKQVDEDFVEDRIKSDKSKHKYPKIYRKPVDITKVDMSVMREWIEKRMEEEVPDDDIIADYVCELLMANDEPDIKAIHLQLEEMLGEKATAAFGERLWSLLVSAQDDPDGVPPELVEERRRQLEERERRAAESSRKKTNYNRSSGMSPASRVRDSRDLDPRDLDKGSSRERERNRNPRDRGFRSRGNNRRAHQS
ncbi:Piso0_005660 [Millerozyma farinosa CBS 7064]|uniref:U1 small nuclear ribonucleoprotein component SNU71 n=1 Tax=Pichia sorbitophila (strain ATCC MYA-4447 / BCRC 22081 / CBS 7064 / NBRC 10061 / NRRL Y-12695) TaxID=559304 RepID=G8XZL2_PICSO|nr:Piso0_005660 [Millerozyma farinosa CBS 7064]